EAGSRCFQPRVEFPLLRTRGRVPLAVTVLPISLASRGTATSCAAVQSTAPFFRRWRPAGFPALRPRAALTGCLKLDRRLSGGLRPGARAGGSAQPGLGLKMGMIHQAVSGPSRASLFHPRNWAREVFLTE